MLKVESVKSIGDKEREERIAKRRARIEALMAAKKQAENDVAGKVKQTAATSEYETISKGKKQIMQSRQRLEHVKLAGVEEVTTIRVTGDEREHARREVEETKARARSETLEQEQQDSVANNAAISMQWSELFNRDVPQDLLEGIMRQREACDEVLSSKDDIINSYKHELKTKDDEYVKALKRQAEDVELLLERMGKQILALQRAYEEELDEIEKSFMQERQTLIEDNRTELEGLFEKRRNMEVHYMESRQQRIESDQSQLEALRVQGAEEYNILKIKLETEIQNLEQRLEEMRATYQLNTEKLDYNYRVLMERDHENSNSIKGHKRKLAKLQDVLSNLMGKYARTDKQFRQENVELTDEYKRITEQYKDLQSKFRHFESADGKRYGDIWAMNEEEVLTKVRKVLQADKVIHEQQLGLPWFPPSEEFFHLGGKPGDKVRGSNNVSDTDRVTPAAGQDQHGDGNGDGDGDESGTSSDKAGNGSPDSATDAAEQQDKDGGDADVKLASGRVSGASVRAMLDILCNEAGFLVEEKVKKLLESLPSDGKNFLKVDTILNALGVETEDDVRKLLSYFVQPGAEADGGANAADASEAAMAEKMIKPEDAVQALKAFVQDHQQVVAERTLSRQSNKRSAAVVPEERYERSRKEEKEYWERMGSVISSKTFRVWTALERAMQQYNHVLTDRAKLMSKTGDLRNQNDELKMLLNQYLTSKVNDELAVPPADVMGV